MASIIALNKPYIQITYLIKQMIFSFLAQITTSSTSINKVDNYVFLSATQSTLEKPHKILPLFWCWYLIEIFKVALIYFLTHFNAC